MDEIKASGGVNLKERDDSGSTPLLFAVKNKRKTAVGVLIRQSADVTAVDNNKKNILHLIAEQNQYDILHIIYEYEGIDKATLSILAKSEDSAGETPLTLQYAKNIQTLPRKL